MVTDEVDRSQERGRRTRAALLDAAVESLVEVGYAATTTVEVARRAGASRGSQVHHFPTRAGLVSSAVEHLLERRTAEFRKVFADVPESVDSLDAVIDLLWSMFQGDAFTAWAELWMAARTDEDLRRVVVDMDRRFVEESRVVFLELFPPADDANAAAQDAGFAFAFALMDGLALQRLVPSDHFPDAEQSIDILKAFASLASSQILSPKDPT